MKVLAFVDVHASISALKKLEVKVKKGKPDALVCAGDFTIFEQNIEAVMQKISQLHSKIFIIPGNHETPQVVKKLCSFHPSLVYLHKRVVQFQKYTFVGYGGGGFSFVDKEFEQFVKKNEPKLKGKDLVLVTHAPLYGTKLDYLYREYCGNKSITQFLKKHPRTKLLVCGHLHETAGKQDKLNKTLVINPGPEGKLVKV